MRKFDELATIHVPSVLPSPTAVIAHHHLQLDTDITHLHNHPGQIEIAYCQKGQGIFVVDSAVIAYGPGDVVIIPSGTPHVIQSVSGTTSDWYFNHFCLATVFTSIASLPSSLLAAGEQWWHFPKATHPNISDTTRLLTGEAVNVLPFMPGHTSTSAQGFILALLSLIDSATASHRQGKPKPCRLQRISPAINYLSSHFSEELDVDGLARYCNFSAVHFRRLFQESVGMAPRDYLFTVRIEMAKAILQQDDRSVLSIAHGVGFSSLSSFNRQFLSRVGMSPREWRQQQTMSSTSLENT